jgi:hypothetical protein
VHIHHFPAGKSRPPRTYNRRDPTRFARRAATNLIAASLTGLFHPGRIRMFGEPPVALRYDATIEQPEADEAEVGQALIDTMRKISETTLEHEGRPTRSVHAKPHGVIVGELEIADGLPPVLAQGLFSRPGRYPVVMRLSTIPGDLLDDSVSTPRGLGLKIIGVQGARLPGSEGDVTQDFVLVNGPAFGAPNAKAFLANLKLLAATTDKIEGVKKVMSGAMQGLQKLVIAASGEPNATIATLGGQPETHILGETFYSQVPILYGDYIAKIAVAPVSTNLTDLTDAPLKVNGVPDALRGTVTEFFASNIGVWEIRAQLCTNLEDTPVENAAKIWPEEESPYITVGRITAAPQSTWNSVREKAVDEGYSFSPWHGLAAHRPLGSVMRVRKAAYEAGAKFRATHGGRTIAEPRTVDF